MSPGQPTTLHLPQGDRAHLACSAVCSWAELLGSHPYRLAAKHWKGFTFDKLGCKKNSELHFCLQMLSTQPTFKQLLQVQRTCPDSTGLALRKLGHAGIKCPPCETREGAPLQLRAPQLPQLPAMTSTGRRTMGCWQ